MSIKPWPVLTLRMQGGPDDGLVIRSSAGASPEPPEQLVSSVDQLGGHYLRRPEPVGQWTWHYAWVVDQAPTLESKG